MTVRNLVLSTFTGVGLLDRGFRKAGYCVVCTGDPLFGQEGLATFHPPQAVFEGIIGGPPCQAWAICRNTREQNGKYPNLIPMFERIVEEAQPEWFLMENVVGAPIPKIEGYYIDSMKLYAYEFGVPQRRYRRFSFGSRPPLQLLWPRGLKPPKGTVTLTSRQSLLPFQRDVWPTFTCTNTTQRVKFGGSRMRNNGKTRFSLDEYRIAFGLPDDWDAPVLLASGKFKVLGNGVPVPVAYALALAIRLATGREAVPA